MQRLAEDKNDRVIQISHTEMLNVACRSEERIKAPLRASPSAIGGTGEAGDISGAAGLRTQAP
jgi:hypothetical protein